MGVGRTYVHTQGDMYTLTYIHTHKYRRRGREREREYLLYCNMNAHRTRRPCNTTLESKMRQHGVIITREYTLHHGRRNHIKHIVLGTVRREHMLEFEIVCLSPVIDRTYRGHHHHRYRTCICIMRTMRRNKYAMTWQSLCEKQNARILRIIGRCNRYYDIAIETITNIAHVLAEFSTQQQQQQKNSKKKFKKLAVTN